MAAQIAEPADASVATATTDAPVLVSSDVGPPRDAASFTGPPSPLDGTYTGPSEAYVVVLGGAVRMIRLRYAGNKGLMFVGARVESEGVWEIKNDAFTVASNAAILRGTFPRPGRIDGTWEEAGVKGPWTASRDGADASVDVRPDVPVDNAVRRDVGPDTGRADSRSN